MTMNNIDKTLNKILGKGKGASVKKQQQWKSFTPLQKNTKRGLFRDSDKDGVPNRWDCQPFNKKKQDNEPIAEMTIQDSFGTFISTNKPILDVTLMEDNSRESYEHNRKIDDFKTRYD